MGAPHATEDDIIHKDYLIPKGSYLIPAVWWLLHDPEFYADPQSFHPERYLAPNEEPDPKPVAFGFGRRKCPGRFLADSSVFLIIAMILAILGIQRDETAPDVKLEYTLGLLAYLPKFPHKIKPRSEEHAQLIRGIEQEHPWEERDSAFLDAFHDS